MFDIFLQKLNLVKNSFLKVLFHKFYTHKVHFKKLCTHKGLGIRVEFLLRFLFHQHPQPSQHHGGTPISIWESNSPPHGVGYNSILISV